MSIIMNLLFYIYSRSAPWQDGSGDTGLQFLGSLRIIIIAIM